MAFFEVEKEKGVATLWLNNPENHNLMRWEFWEELPKHIKQLEQEKDVNCIRIAGKGDAFSAGLDILDVFQKKKEISLQANAEERLELYETIVLMQNAINCVYECTKPVVAAIHGYCIGGGLDLISACDIRVASKTAIFSLREVRVAIVADMGSLQRLPAIIGEGITRDLALTGRDFNAEEALRIGLITHLYETDDQLFDQSFKFCLKIAKNSAFVTKGVKHVLNKQRDMTLSDSLNYVLLYNSAFLHSKDLQKTVERFEKLMKKSTKNK
ncbi:MAG: enoyl-CoA hydratase [Candidatus Hydrogenedentota bacterium]|nr:MAG: enoyl-CoA hydratase [Candidatus Hydrogenedentota bacterium]